MDNEVVLMFSGGKDSFLSACKLIEDGNRVNLVHFHNGYTYGYNNVLQTAGRLIEKYGSDAVSTLGDYNILGILREFIVDYMDLKPAEQKKLYGDITPSQINCLTCRSAMYVYSILLAKKFDCRIVAEGARLSQGFAIESEEMILRYRQLCESEDKFLDTPLYNLDDDWVRDNEMLRRGFIPKVSESKCLLGCPLSHKLSSGEINGVCQYYDKVILPKIHERDMLCKYNIDVLLYDNRMEI